MQKNLEPAYSIDVTCHRCGETWRLNPKMWRNFDTVRKIGKKRIVCPYCSCHMFLNKQQTKELMEQKKEYDEYKRKSDVHASSLKIKKSPRNGVRH